MFTRFSRLLAFFLSFVISALIVSAEVQVTNDIDISVSPFRFDLSLMPGEGVTREITVFNNTNITRSLSIKKENFLSNNITGQPQFYEEGQSGGAGTYRLSQWITLGQSSITVPARGRANVSYTITAPASATPGGYYGAITFLNQDATATGNLVRFDKKIASIILLTVSGAVNIDVGVNPGDITVSQSTGGGTPFNPNTTIEAKPIPWYQRWLGLEEDTPLNNFSVEFHVPITNSGNVHIRPKGKIKLIDENGNPLKAIGRESIVDENGIIVSEQTVDYIPLNNEDGAILPGSSRTFAPVWQGYVEEYIDRYGKKQYRYLTPSEKSAGRSLNTPLYPWQKLITTRVQKPLTAEIEIEYTDEKGKKVVLNSAPKFIAVYDEARVTLNYVPLALIIVPVATLFGAMVYYIALTRRRRKNLKAELRREIEREMKSKKQ